MNVSHSSFNISLICDTSASTSASSPSSSPDNISLSPLLPSQPLILAVRVFLSQRPDQLLDITLFSTPNDHHPPFWGAGIGKGLAGSLSLVKITRTRTGVVKWCRSAGWALLGSADNSRLRSMLLHGLGIYLLDQEEVMWWRMGMYDTGA